MYQVRCDNVVIYDLRDEDLKIISPSLSTEVNKTGSFTFTIPPQNPCYDLIKKLSSLITIYQDGEEIWRGRVLNDKLDFYNRKQVECEGELSFLLDSIQRPYVFQGSPNDLFKQFINTHNSQVEDKKKFVIRNVNVPDNNNYINRENSDYSNTWDAVNEKIIDTNGGYIETGPLSSGERYIDFISEYTHVNSQVIQFGENLLDITQYAKGENIKTAIIPIGAKDEETEEKLTIESVNNGKDYIYDEVAVSLFGWIWDTVEYEDVTIASNLLTKGKKYLNSVINESMTIELSAADLHYLNCDIEKFKKGDLVRVISIPHSIDKYFQVSKLTINLDNPTSSLLTLGQTFTTLTQKQIQENKNIKNLIVTVNAESTKTKKEVSNLKKDVTKIESDVQNIDNTIVEIPTKYVKTTDFENYKNEVNQKLGSVYTVKGSLADYETLIATTNNQIGDVYNLLDTGANYVYTATGWDKLSETIDLSAYMKKEDAEIEFVSKTSYDELVQRVEILENNSGTEVEPQE